MMSVVYSACIHILYNEETEAALMEELTYKELRSLNDVL